MHHEDLALEPELGLLGAANRPRKRSSPQGGEATVPDLGFPPMEVLDLWQRHVCKILRWLAAHPERASAVLEAVAQLEPSMQTSPLPSRNWRSMVGCGCVGRFVLQLPPSDVRNESSSALDAAVDPSAGYEAWLRSQVAEPTSEPSLLPRRLTIHEEPLTLERAVCVPPPTPPPPHPAPPPPPRTLHTAPLPPLLDLLSTSY